MAIGALIGVGASIYGMSQARAGQQQTNQMSMDEMMQNEQWQTQMSNTAMQRRVADLKAAGLNPMLAVGQGGANVPGVSQAPLQNPNAQMAGLGGEISSALQLRETQARIDLANAQADNVRHTTSDVMPAQVASIRQSTITSDAQAQQVWQNLQLMYSQMRSTDAQTALTNLQRELATQDLTVRKATQQAIIRMTNDEAYAASVGAKNLTTAERSWLAQFAARLGLSSAPVSSAAGVVGSAVTKIGGGL